MRSKSHFPFDGKCSYFVRMRRLSADKRMQTGEIWAFNGNISLFPYVCTETNLIRAALCPSTHGKMHRNCRTLLFSAVARRTLVLRTAENKALYQFNLWQKNTTIEIAQSRHFSCNIFVRQRRGFMCIFPNQ